MLLKFDQITVALMTTRIQMQLCNNLLSSNGPALNRLTELTE